MTGTAERNRDNARRSTGPRTAAGRQAVAGNARRHGAQSRPDRGKVATWLRIILDRPVVTIDDLQDERGLRALALAEAEARLAACREALHDFETGQPDRHFGGQPGLPDFTVLPPVTDREILAAFELLADELIAGLDEDDKPVEHRLEKRRRLLKRYLGEARARRNRAFRAWTGYLESAGSVAGRV